MGSYTKNLFKKDRVINRIHTTVDDSEPEAKPKEVIKIVSCAIIRDDKVISGKFRSHSDVRAHLGDEDPYEQKNGDQHGFVTSGGVYVNRRAAGRIAYEAGQTNTLWPELLSSEIKW
jgi:hypothetical protein